VKLICVRCDSDLTEPEALVLSPARTDGSCHKFRLCFECYRILAKWFLSKGNTPP
jgi:hypothetical protein